MKRFSAAVRPALFTLSLFGLALASAQTSGMQPAAPAVASHFLRTDGIDATAILPPPPAAGSLAEQADIETVLQVQAARTPEQVEWAKRVDKNDLFAAFELEKILDRPFDKDRHPLLVALLKDAREDLRPLVDASKKLFARPRPYVTEPRIKPCVGLPTNDSYPSGHTWGAWVFASVLAEVFPEKRVELLARAHTFAWGRVIAGVHYPTDLAGGFRLAEAGLAELKKTPAFRAAVEKCRREAAGTALRKAS